MGKYRPLTERLLGKIIFPDDTLNDCWGWSATLHRQGYGMISGENGSQNVLAHRASYELFIGPIPDDLELDHLCRNTTCPNPWHLEPVTHQENVRRGAAGAYQQTRAHCKRGHEYTEENAGRWGKRKGRTCRICERDRNRRYYHARKLKGGSPSN